MEGGMKRKESWKRKERKEYKTKKKKRKEEKGRLKERGKFKDLFLEHNRTDNGREYVNQNLERILKKLGIKYQLTVPYSSQNGLAKSMNL